MPHVVLVVNPLASLLNTSLGAAKRLEAAGFRTTFVCTPNLVERLEAEGMNVAVLTQDERFAGQAAADPRPALTNPTGMLAWLGRRRALRSESLASTEIADVVQSLNPDLLLINAESHVAMISTCRLGIPTVATTNFFSVFRGSELPPLSMTMAPPADRFGRVKVGAAWWWIRIASVLGRVQHRFSLAGVATSISPVLTDTVNLDDLKQVARAAGVDLASITDRSQWLRPHVYRDLPLLSFTAREMELPHQPDDRVAYVGPMVNAERLERSLPAEQLARLQMMKDQRGVGGGDRPLLYCSLGTVWSADQRLLRQVVELLNRRPDWNLVLSLGGSDPSAMGLGAVPSNALVLDWAPQLDILASADCFITHGGVKSLSEAIHFEVPMVVYPTGFVDQNGNARRVQHHHLGIMGERAAASDSAESIESDVERAMSDPTIPVALAQMRRSFGAYEAAPIGRGDGALVEQIKRYLVEGS